MNAAITGSLPMKKDMRELKAIYEKLDDLVDELIDLDFAAEIRRVRRALLD